MMMTNELVDWTKPIELRTDPPRPARVVRCEKDSDGSWSWKVSADWPHYGVLEFWVAIDGRVKGLNDFPRVRNVRPGDFEPAEPAPDLAVKDLAHAAGVEVGMQIAGDLAAELAEALKDCADDLEAEVEARRGTVLERTTERDLATVRKARAALAKWEARK